MLYLCQNRVAGWRRKIMEKQFFNTTLVTVLILNNYLYYWMKHFYSAIIILFLFCSIAVTGIGQSTSVRTVNSKRAFQTEKIKLFPNPATDRFTVKIPSEVMKYLTINNIIGKEIRKVEARPDQSYQVSDLRRGVYIIRVFDHQDKLLTALRLTKT